MSVVFNVFTKVRCTETGSVQEIKGPCSAPKPVLKI